MKRAKNTAYLDGIGMNPVYQSNREIYKIDKLCKKLKPWLKSAKRWKNVDKNIQKYSEVQK